MASPALSTWVGLNDAVLTMGEQECLDLIREEMRGERRKMFILRIFSRYNRLRGQRERAELLKEMDL
jgi:hypothetical protein